MLFGLGYSDKIEVGPLHWRQDLVGKTLARFVPRLFDQIFLDRTLLENTAVFAKYDAPQQCEIVGVIVLLETCDLRLCKPRFREVEFIKIILVKFPPAGGADHRIDLL